jgi:L-fuconolactonase
MGHLNRPIGFGELEPTLDRLGIDGIVLVQSADNADDTELMLETADHHPRVVAVVAWAPLDRPENLAEHLALLCASPLVVGIRNLVHEREPGWLLRPETGRGLDQLARAELTLDFPTTGPDALAELPELSARHPELRIVVDHLGKPPIGGTADDRLRWRDLLTAAAENPRTHAKLSGLAPFGNPSWNVDQLRPFVDDALELFGPNRLIYGGDWPICELAGGYERTWAAMTELLAPLSPHERAAILGGTAEIFYGTEPSDARRPSDARQQREDA